MKVYFAGPLFSTSERSWNAEVTAALRAAGHEVFLPQESESGKDAAGIFAADKAGIDWSDALVAIMDGPTPDAGTCWEVGHAFGKRPIVLVRTDFRVMAGSAGKYNPMLTEAATVRLDLPSSPTHDVVSAILSALAHDDVRPGLPETSRMDPAERWKGTPSKEIRYADGGADLLGGSLRGAFRRPSFPRCDELSVGGGPCVLG